MPKDSASRLRILFMCVYALCVVGICVGTMFDFDISMALMSESDLGAAIADYWLCIVDLFYAFAGTCLFVGLRQKGERFELLARVALGIGMSMPIIFFVNDAGWNVRAMMGYVGGESSPLLALVSLAPTAIVVSAVPLVFAKRLEDKDPDKLIATGVFLIACGICAQYANDLLKPLFSRPRPRYLVTLDDPAAEFRAWWQMAPYADGPNDAVRSCPSNHMMLAALMFNLPVIVSVVRHRSEVIDWASIGIACVYVAVMAYDIIYGDLPGIRFSRKGTLGRGDAVCDFDVSLAKGTAEVPRKLLVVGVGVIGSYLTQVLCEAGHDVCVVARGGWADTIERDGLRIRHYLQRKDTTCHPRVVRELPTREHFDATFVVMRQDQMVALAPELSAIDTGLVVCVGNDLKVNEVEATIRTDGSGPQRVLFGFQGTAGHREARRTVVVRFGAWHLTVGPDTGEISEQDRTLLECVFCGSYRASFEHDMHWWLVCHAVSVLPFCFLAYRLDCDLTKATAEDVTRLTDAMLEGYEVVLATGGMILPEGDEDFLKPGPKRVAWEFALRAMAKTAIGRLCVTDHCKNAVSEMRALDKGINELFLQAPEVAHPSWDALRGAMPSWDELERTWQS